MKDIMLPVSILLAAVLITLGLMFVGRYEISAPMQGGNVWRVDRLTGNLAVCGAFDDQITCKPVEE
ncbi:MAG: hypothetical protein WBE04_12320 [Methyloceanibacter sp.]